MAHPCSHDWSTSLGGQHQADTDTHTLPPTVYPPAYTTNLAPSAPSPSATQPLRAARAAFSRARTACNAVVHRGSIRAKQQMQSFAQNVQDPEKRELFRHRIRHMLVNRERSSMVPRKLSSVTLRWSDRASSQTLDRESSPREKIGIADEEFAGCETLFEDDEPGADWDLLSELPAGKCWRKQQPGSDAFVYRTYVTMSEPLPLLLAALTDVERRKEWDAYCIDIREVDKLGDTSVVYWRVKFPFPLSDRDYVYYRRHMENKKGEVLVLSRSAPVGAHVGEVSSVIRIDEFRTRCALRSTPDGGTDYRMEYWEEQKGNVPQWAVRWAMDKAVDSMLEGMKKHMKLLAKEN
eukprot:CAMPEP_0181310168 /NCGR_PEP_ID=MMETSP1101-20121128/12439_1 /TAXON_ID=46948 /ORGANISM="Rhodomonas abbreviata, Strain Caron Lab Isolate" /LENGTH=349 /DNA_ID=CAMNT_0023416773 /DNA_START=336 /DNA_END=1385 /DNA_ORIENTATION=+